MRSEGRECNKTLATKPRPGLRARKTKRAPLPRRCRPSRSLDESTRLLWPAPKASRCPRTAVRRQLHPALQARVRKCSWAPITHPLPQTRVLPDHPPPQPGQEEERVHQPAESGRSLSPPNWGPERAPLKNLADAGHPRRRTFSRGLHGGLGD